MEEEILKPEGEEGDLLLPSEVEESLLSDEAHLRSADAVSGGQGEAMEMGGDGEGPLPPPQIATSANNRRVKRRARRRRAKELRAWGVPSAPKSNDDVTATATTTTNITAPTTTTTTATSAAATGSKVFPSTPLGGGGQNAGSSSSTTTNNKRGRETPTSNNPREKKRPSTYREVVIEGSEVVITYKDDPHRPLSKKDQEAIQVGLRSAIDAAAATTLLKFGGLVIRGGGMVLTCRDPTTKLWAEAEVDKLEGGKFATSDPKPPEAEAKVSFWVREATPPLAKVDLHPINRGHRATFVVSNKKEVLDVTFVSSHLLDRIKAWWVDDNESCSDHRDRKRTRWDLYKSVLKGLTELDPARACPMSSTEEIEASASRVSNFIHKSYDVACPEKVPKSRRKRVPWWSRELTSLRKEARRLYRVARFGGEEAWAEYKAARNYYSYEMRRRKTASWRRFCESVEEAPVAARLSRILRNDGTIKLGSLDKGDGVYTRTLSETYELLLDQSFPRDPQRVPWEPDHSKVDDESINLMITSSKISNIINSFGPLKAAGKDGIFPALLQHGLAESIPYLVPLMRGCLTFGYTPLKWRESRVVFLPKPGKESYERASAWRPICLTSFLLKTLEKLVDGWVRTPDLVDRLQRHSQYAYMKGVSTEAALHQIVSLVEGALDSSEYCIAVMLDVKGAFNEVRSDTIIRSLRRFGVNEVCVRYIEHMLRTRTTWVTDSTYEIGRVVERGCPQGGVLSPLLWDLVVSEILEKLHHRFPQLYSQGFADDLTTVGRGIDLGTVGSHVQRAVNLVSDWCKEVSLSVNDKLALVLFTKKYKFIAPVIKLDGIPIPYQKQVRYLGVLLDHKLNWGPLCRARALKGMRALSQCRRAIGKTWGLSPKITNWIYKSIIRPAMEYGSLLWAPATKVKSHMAQLQRVQRCAMLGTTGVMSSTPTAALECLLGLVPVDIRVQQVALRTYHRLAHHGQWKKWAGGDRTRALKHNKFVEIMASGIDEFQMPCEKLVNPPAERNFETSICSVKDWEDGSVPMNASDVNCFTDGSRMGECSGAAYYFTYNNLAQEAVRCSIPLGWAPTVFQAEIMGIIRASETLTDNTHNYSTVDFFIDSQGAIKALTSPWPVSSLTSEAIEMLNHIGETKKVTLHWIPSHHGFEGNEVADLLAKEGTLTGYLGPQPSIPLSRSTVISSIVNWARLQHIKSWESSNCLTSKAFLSAPSSGLSSKL
ncbi:uncharacterized protein LOC110861000 [Folsomia candida]|uniref:uncharacterized protein LOC110861000 n=1 Tax=Folsomia candida TaxID=158441 RepID=UPI000B8F4A66|nr:uncharacterized protein LOC110861000 [Folsomia candida]